MSSCSSTGSAVSNMVTDKALLYRVVEFKDKKVEAIPKSWMNEDDPDNVTCAWPPPSKNFLSLVKSQTVPSEDWTNESCHVLKCYATLLEARSKTKKIENDQPSSCDEFGRGFRKAKTAFPTSAVIQMNSASCGYDSPSSSSTCSDFQNEGAHASGSKFPKKIFISSDSEDLGEPTYKKIKVLHSAKLTDTPVHKRYKQPQFVSSYDRRTSFDGHLTPAADQTLTPTVPPIVRSTEERDLLQQILQSVDGVSGRMQAIEAQQQLILEEIAQLRVEVQQNAKTTFKNNDAYAIDGNTTLEVLPLKTIGEITDFEEELNEEEVLQQYVSHLMIYICPRIDDSVRKCLSSVYTNELSTRCGWTGAKNNFKVMTLKQIGIIEGAIRKRHPSMSKDEFKKHASNWFRRAHTRLGRRKEN